MSSAESTGDNGRREFEVTGRGLDQPVVILDTFPDRVAVRVECEKNAEFWFSLELTTDDLLSLVRGIVNAQCGEQDSAHDLIDELEALITNNAE